MKHTKSSILVLILLSIISCQTSETKKHEKENKIEKIQIKAMDMETLTFISIDCDKFIGEIDYSITDTAEINVILSQLKNMEPLDSGNWNIDTRAKLVLYSANDTNTICASLFILKYNDKFYHTPEWLIDYIENLTNEYYDAKAKITQ